MDMIVYIIMSVCSHMSAIIYYITGFSNNVLNQLCIDMVMYSTLLHPYLISGFS